MRHLMSFRAAGGVHGGRHSADERRLRSLRSAGAMYVSLSRGGGGLLGTRESELAHVDPQVHSLPRPGQGERHRALGQYLGSAGLDRARVSLALRIRTEDFVDVVHIGET